MAGTLVIDTLKASTGVFASQNAMSGIAQAWARFNGSTGVTISSFNVTSVTRSGTGTYIVNFTTAIADANYAVFCNAGNDGVTWRVASAQLTSNLTTTTARVECATLAGASTDTTLYSVAIFR